MGSDSSDSSTQNEEQLKRDFFARLEACEENVGDYGRGVCSAICLNFGGPPEDHLISCFSCLYEPDRFVSAYWLSSEANHYWQDGLTGRERRIKYLRKFRDYLLEKDRWEEFVREGVQ